MIVKKSSRIKKSIKLESGLLANCLLLLTHCYSCLLTLTHANSYKLLLTNSNSCSLMLTFSSACPPYPTPKSQATDEMISYDLRKIFNKCHYILYYILTLILQNTLQGQCFNIAVLFHREQFFINNTDNVKPSLEGELCWLQ